MCIRDSAYTGGTYTPPGPRYPCITSSGACVTTSGNYKIAVFNGSGSLTVNSLGSDASEGKSVTALVVAGGGASGRGYGGGGGAGGFNCASKTVTTTTYSVAVGAGGYYVCTCFPYSPTGGVGTSSSLGALISTCGGLSLIHI